MTISELKAALEERQEMQRIIDEAKTVLDARTDEIKAHMSAEGVSEMTVGAFKVTWKFNKPRIVPDADKLKAAGIFDLYSKEQAPARPFVVK